MKSRAIKPSEVWPRGWKDLLTDHPLAIGGDLATTEKKTSNPSSIAVVQKVGLDFIVRAVVRFKTDNEGYWESILDEALALPRGLRARRVCLDASNERFFASRQKNRLAGRVVVELAVNSENIEFLGETMLMKAYLGNLFCNTIEDGRLLLPQEDWLQKDIRLVKNDRGSFVADLDAAGNHGDSFDAIKLGLHGLITKSGPAEANAAPVGSLGAPARVRPGLLNRFAHLFRK